MRILVKLAVLLAFLPLVGCDNDEPEANTDDPQYKLGYAAGHSDGESEKETELCKQIEDYKDSIADALKDADICPNNR